MLGRLRAAAYQWRNPERPNVLLDRSKVLGVALMAIVLGIAALVRYL